MTIFTQGSAPVATNRPGVQIVDVPPQVVAASAQPSNVVAIVGTAAWGPTDIAIRVSTPVQAALVFGSSQLRKHDLLFSMYAAWLQGAANFVLVRASLAGQLAATKVIKGATGDSAGIGVTAKWPGTLGNQIQISLTPGSKSGSLKATVKLAAIKTEVYNNLGVVPVGQTGAGTVTAKQFWTDFYNAVNLGKGANAISDLIIVGTLPTTWTGYTAPTTALLTQTLVGGADATDYTAMTTYDLVGDPDSRSGMYALANTQINHLVVAESDELDTYTGLATYTGTQSVVDAFAAATGVYAHVNGPLGELPTDAITNKVIDSPWTSLTLGDWPTVYDPTNRSFRQIGPAILKAGVLAALAPNNSSLNKPIRGIVTTQRSGNYANGLTTYSDSEIGSLLNVGVDVISNPSPGGTFFSFQGGVSSSSDASVNSDSWPMMESLIGRALASQAGQFIGRPMASGLLLNVTVSFQNTLNNFVRQGYLNPGSFVVECDRTNNPFSSTSVGILVVNVTVTYMSIVKFMNVMLEGGPTVQAVSVNTSTTG